MSAVASSVSYAVPSGICGSEASMEASSYWCIFEASKLQNPK